MTASTAAPLEVRLTHSPAIRRYNRAANILAALRPAALGLTCGNVAWFAFIQQQWPWQVAMANNVYLYGGALFALVALLAPRSLRRHAHQLAVRDDERYSAEVAAATVAAREQVLYLESVEELPGDQLCLNVRADLLHSPSQPIVLPRSGVSWMQGQGHSAWVQFPAASYETFSLSFGDAAVVMSQRNDHVLPVFQPTELRSLGAELPDWLA